MKKIDIEQIIMRCVNDSEEPIHLKEIERRTGVNYTAVVRTVNSLEHSGKIRTELRTIEGRAHRFVIKEDP